MAPGIVALAAPITLGARLRAKLLAPVSKIKISGKAVGMAEGGAEIEFKASSKVLLARLRQAFAAFDASENRGLLMIDVTTLTVSCVPPLGLPVRRVFSSALSFFDHTGISLSFLT